MRGNHRQARRGPSPLAVAPASGTRGCQSGLWQPPPTAGRPPGVVERSRADAPRPEPSAPGRSVDSPAARAHRRGCPQARPGRTVPACAPRGPAHPAPWPARVASPSPSPPRSVPGPARAPPCLLPPATLVPLPLRFLQHGVQVGRGASHSQRAPSLTFKDLQRPSGTLRDLHRRTKPRARCLRSTWGHLAVGRRVGVGPWRLGALSPTLGARPPGAEACWRRSAPPPTRHGGAARGGLRLPPVKAACRARLGGTGPWCSRPAGRRCRKRPRAGWAFRARRRAPCGCAGT